MEQDRELKIIIKAKELNKHTFKLTSNCNRFPKKYRFTLCDRMQRKSMDIYEYLMEANRTDLNTSKKRRFDLQSKVVLLCDELLYYIELCIELEILASKSAEYWSKLVSDVKYMTLAWRTKDKERQQHR